MLRRKPGEEPRVAAQNPRGRLNGDKHQCPGKRTQAGGAHQDLRKSPDAPRRVRHEEFGSVLEATSSGAAGLRHCGDIEPDAPELAPAASGLRAHGRSVAGEPPFHERGPPEATSCEVNEPCCRPA